MVLGCDFSYAAESYAQATTISINAREKSVREVFSEIESISEYIFFYYDGAVDLDRKVSLTVEDATIDVILDRLFENTDSYYTISDRQITIVRKAEPEPAPRVTRQPREPVRISGTVTDEAGVPMVGVSVVVEGTTTGTITNNSGEYSIAVAGAEGAVLRFSFLGFSTRHVEVGGRRTVNVTLSEDTSQIEQVVIVGYGSQKKVSVTGAIATIQTADLTQSSAPNLSAALAGRLPGLVTMQTSGQPGRDEIIMYLRGVGTTNGSSPLIMIDGVPRDNISTLDPNEVASISILKDASATAVFGVRGANGVILITTRRGTTGKAQLSITADYSMQQFMNRPDRMHSWDYAELRNQALRNNGIREENLPFTPYMLEKYRDGSDRVFYPDRDIYHEVFRDWSPQRRLNINLDGGTDDVQYFLNIGYIGQNGMIKTEPKSQLGYDPNFKLDRYNFRSNVDYQIVKGLKFSVNIAAYLEKMNSPMAAVGADDNGMDGMVRQLMAYVWSLPPTDPGPVTAEGYGVEPGKILFGVSNNISIYGDVNRRGYRKETNTMLNSSAALDWDLGFITKGLNTRLMISYDTKARTNLLGFRQYEVYGFNVARTADEECYYSLKIGGEDEAMKLSKVMQSYYYVNLQYSINYARQFDRHNLSATALLQRDNWENKGYGADLPYNMMGLVGRVTYSYADRYLAEVNAGYNGSEQFAKSNRYGFFPAVSAGWVASNESFLRDNRVLTHLKFRASYGKVGNDQLGGSRFLYMDHTQNYYGGVISSLNWGQHIVQGMMGNPNLQWEVAYKQNYGVDLELWRDVSLTVDGFKENRDHILITPGTVPQLQGIATQNLPKYNMGKMINRGFEVELTYRKRFKPDIFLMVKSNFAYNKNKLTYADEPILSEEYAYRYRATGYPFGQPFGFKIDYSNGNGYINTREELDNLPEYRVGGTPRLGDFIYQDINGDGMINEKDMVPMGFGPIPRISYGIQFSVKVKNFDFSCLLNGIGQSSMMYGGWGIYEFGLLGFYDGWHLNAWTEERYRNGEKITYPALGAWDGTSNKANDHFLLSRSYLRLRNIELGYSLPAKILRPAKISQLRVYVGGDNLYTWHKLPVNTIDPEQVESNVYPLLKIVKAGINLVF